MHGLKRLVLVLVVAGAAACASGRAQVIEDQPTLAVPPVPARTIEAQPQIEPPVSEPIVEPVPALPPPVKPRPNTRAASEPKPEPKPEVPAETANSTVPNPPPVAALRTPSTPSGPDATRQIQESLQRTESILSRVNYQRLSDDKRANYDNAKAWMEQAREAIKKDDLRQAQNFAERAENVAKQLETR
jgi:outer membrane biosynthesis protein TonB